MPAFLLNSKPTSQVVDACAAPGMKTTHLASIMQNKGQIWALDRDKNRFKTLKDMLRDSNVKNTEALNTDFLREHTAGPDYEEVSNLFSSPSNLQNFL